MILYVASIFFSALLLFLVQPIVGRLILPWYGGTALVWTTCLLFFQSMLLAGYAYSSWSLRWLRPTWQVSLHCGWLLVAALTLPLALRESLKPTVSEHPTWSILLMLAAVIGLPFFILSTTGPTIQAWQARTHTGRSPYRLFAISNAGSLAALMIYPFLIEPTIGLKMQTVIWSVGFVVFAVFMIWCSVRYAILFRRGVLLLPGDAVAQEQSLPTETRSVSKTRKRGKKPTSLEPTDFTPSSEKPVVRHLLMWILLATAPSALLVSTSELLTHELSSSPFLWVVPLSLYLLSFIICFENPHWYFRAVFVPLFFVTAVVASGVTQAGLDVPFPIQLVSLSLALFAGAMVCHGELERAKPHRDFLTTFYLMVAIGGAVGGILVAIVAPWIFSGHYEYYLVLVACLGLGSSALLVQTRTHQQLGWASGLVLFGLAASLTAIAVNSPLIASEDQQMKVIHRERNAYGVLSVKQDHDLRSLVHGRTVHGYQARDPRIAHRPIAYYSMESGVGVAMRAIKSLRDEQGESLRVGVIGLGAGTMAAYSMAGDQFSFYEIDPAVARLADRYFSYLRNAQGEVQIVMGDGRLELERQWAVSGSQNFDVLVLDAFSSDSVPMHLMTREALVLYRRHVKPDGVIIFHVTNRFLDLRSVTYQLAQDAGLEPILLDHQPNDAFLYHSSWVALTNNRELATRIAQFGNVIPRPDNLKQVLWTDDHSSLIPLINWSFSIW